MHLPKISEALTSEQLRDRVLAQMNGEAVRLSAREQERRRLVLARLQKDGKR